MPFVQDILASRRRDESDFSDWLSGRAVHQLDGFIFPRLDALHDFGRDWSAPVAPRFHQDKHRRASAVACVRLFLPLDFHHAAVMDALF